MATAALALAQSSEGGLETSPFPMSARTSDEMAAKTTLKSETTEMQ